MDTDIVAVTAPRSAALPRSLQGNLRVPSQWHITPLKAFLRVRSERQRPDLPLLSVYRDHGVVPFGSVEGNYNKPSLDLDGYKVVRVGDLVLNKMKTWQGSLAVSGLEGLVSPAYIVCRVGETWHGRFLHYLLRSHPYIAEYAALSYGVRPAQWDMRFEDFRLVSALEPPLEQQRSIADFLDRETEKIDTLVAKKQRLIELLEEKRVALISDAVTKGLDSDAPMKDSGVEWFGQIPRDWAVLPLKRVASVRYGLGQPPAELPEGIPIVRATDISRGVISEAGMLHIDPDDVPKTRDAFLAAGEIIVVRSGAYTGDSAVVPEHLAGCVAGYDMVVHVREADASFISWHLLAVDVRVAQWEPLMLRAAQPHLNAEELASTLICCPPEREQRRIATHLADETARLTELCHREKELISLLLEYRSALITAAVTGLINVRDYVSKAS